MTDGGGPRPTTARELLERAEEGWRRFHAGVHHVGLRHFDARTPAGWRYRDLVAHASAWHRIAAEDIGHLRNGRVPPDREQVDDINAQVARAAEVLPPHRLVEELEASWEELRAAIASLSDEALGTEQGWIADKVAVNTWEHYDEHRPELLAARPATAPDFLARLDDDWSVVQAALAALGGDGLERPTGSGWRYRDLIAHATGWLRDAAERLPAVLADPQVVLEPVDVDAFNATSLEARRDGPAEELLRELRESYAALRTVIGRLTDDELGDRRISGFLAARSYLHVDEHLRELEAAAAS